MRGFASGTVISNVQAFLFFNFFIFGQIGHQQKLMIFLSSTRGIEIKRIFAVRAAVAITLDQKENRTTVHEHVRFFQQGDRN